MIDVREVRGVGRLGIAHAPLPVMEWRIGKRQGVHDAASVYEYPAYDDAVLVWQGVGSQLIIEGLSDAVCDVVNVYSN